MPHAMWLCGIYRDATPYSCAEIMLDFSYIQYITVIYTYMYTQDLPNCCTFTCVWTILYVQSLIQEFLSNNCKLVCPQGPKLEINYLYHYTVYLFHNMFKLLSSNRKKKELKLIKSCVYNCNTFHFLTFYSEKCKFNTALFLRFSQEYNYSFTSKFISVTCICSLCA